MLKPKFLFLCIIAMLLLLLQACATDGEQWNPNDYTVKRGDSVFSIAWRYELDPVAFAHWNNLSRPFLIYPGQRLHIRKPVYSPQHYPAQQPAVVKSIPPVRPVSTGSLAITVKLGDTLYALSKSHHLSVAELARFNHLTKPYQLMPGQKLRLTPSSAAIQHKTSYSTVPPQRGEHKLNVMRRPATPPAVAAQKWAATIHWRWPVKGKVLKSFRRNKPGARGIDIAGSMGARVNAAADGKVVYSGNGLISYGNLVIIKHNNHFLSAYAYNHKLLVHEGQWVKAGQQIAEMGRKGSGRPRMHFEIRKNGKPVNPQYYLPH